MNRAWTGPVWLLAFPLLITSGILGCAGSAPSTHTGDPADPGEAEDTTGQSPTPGGVPHYRFRMISPANEDFAFSDDDVHIYVKPFEDYLSIKVRSRQQNFIRIYWDDSEFVDILGRRYKLVPSTMPLEEAARGIPPIDIQEGALYSGRLHLLDRTDIATIQQLGGKPRPVVPPDAGSPDQVRRQLFELGLSLELNDQPREYNFTFEIREVYYR